MSNIAVVYKSKYGFTKFYAQLLSEKLNADLFVVGSIKPEELQKYDILVFGGGLYGGGVNGIKLLIDNFNLFKDKSIYLFTVGAADVTKSENIDGIKSALSKVLSIDMQEKIKIYHLRGGMKYSKMSIAHKSMMWIMIKMLSKKPKSQLRDEDIDMIDTYNKDTNFTDAEAIMPILQSILMVSSS